MGLVLLPGGEMEKGHGKWSFSPPLLPILRKVWMGEEVVAHTPPPTPPRLTPSFFTCSRILRLPKWTWGQGQCSNPTRPGGTHPRPPRE